MDGVVPQLREHAKGGQKQDREWSSFVRILWISLVGSVEHFEVLCRIS